MKRRITDPRRGEDPEFQEMRRLFVGESAERVRELAGLLESAGPELPRGPLGSRFRKIAHDLRAAGGAYGFPVVTLHAGDVEDAYVEMGNPEALRALVAMLEDSIQQAGVLSGLPEDFMEYRGP